MSDQDRIKELETALENVYGYVRDKMTSASLKERKELCDYIRDDVLWGKRPQVTS